MSIGILNPVEQIGKIDAATVTAIVNEELTDPRLGAGVTGYVIDANSKQVLVDINSDQPMIPASTLKLYTAIAALDVLGGANKICDKGDARSNPTNFGWWWRSNFGFPHATRLARKATWHSRHRLPFNN